MLNCLSYQHICPYCGKIYQGLETRRFCSRTCVIRYYWQPGNSMYTTHKGHHHSDEHRQKISQALRNSVKFKKAAEVKRGHPGVPRYYPALEPSNPLAYILGALQGDGCIYRSTIQLSVANNVYAESVARALSQIGLPATVIPILMRGKQHYRAYVGSVLFARWYKSLNITEIKRIIKGYEVEFLRGFYEAEGCFSNRMSTSRGYTYRRYTVFISNTQEGLIRLCYDILLGLGFHPYIYRPKQNYPKAKPLFQVFIGRRQEVEEFLGKVVPCIKNGG